MILNKKDAKEYTVLIYLKHHQSQYRLLTVINDYGTDSIGIQK